MKRSNLNPLMEISQATYLNAVTKSLKGKGLDGVSKKIMGGIDKSGKRHVKRFGKFIDDKLGKTSYDRAVDLERKNFETRVVGLQQLRGLR